ncbi:MAG TPA: BamA/TamA family outer membrane protein [Burkholderiaceae bacterium]
MAHVRAFRAATLLLSTLLLAGCGSLSALLSGSDDGKQKADSAASAASEPAINTDRADYRIEVQAPDELRRLLLNYLDLARFQDAPATERITGAELARLERGAPAQARGLLETEGYFNADVAITRENGPNGLPLLRVRVDPGPRTTIAAFTIEADSGGSVADAAELEALRAQWAMPPGTPFRQSLWASAKNATLARLRADGYAAANWRDTAATVDAAHNTATLALVAETGPRYRLGELRIEGLSRYQADTVRRLATFEPGEAYTEKQLLDFQERLQKVGLFEGASVELDPAVETHDAAPVLVRVKELPLQQATIGIGYSANTGPRVSLEHYHRRLFRFGGDDWVAKNKFELGPSLKSWEGQLTSHPLPDLYRNLIAGTASRLRTDDQIQSSWSARVGRTQDSPRFERLYYAELSHARVDSDTVVSSAEAVTANYQWIRRDLDNVLLPTRGNSLSLQGAVGYGRGTQTTGGVTEEGRGPFTRVYARYTWYRPFGKDWYATLRAEAGEVFAKQVLGVPDTLLFRAGGDNSVRGYGYRTLGPEVNGAVTSGRTLLTGSAEIARPISPKYPAFWWAAFVDAGNAADRWRDLHPVFGYGVGLRWRSPVGPLRVDFAYGEAVRQFRVHLSVGIAF